MKRPHRNRFLFSLLLSAICLPAYTVAAQTDGKALHDANCIRCHVSMLGGDGNGIYTREDRKVTTWAGLVKQVTRCKTSLGIPWDEKEIKLVTKYLNDQFYKFKAE